MTSGFSRSSPTSYFAGLSMARQAGEMLLMVFILIIILYLKSVWIFKAFAPFMPRLYLLRASNSPMKSTSLLTPSTGMALYMEARIPPTMR